MSDVEEMNILLHLALVHTNVEIWGHDASSEIWNKCLICRYLRIISPSNCNNAVIKPCVSHAVGSSDPEVQAVRWNIR